MLVISPNPVLFEYSTLRKDADVELAKRIMLVQRATLLQRLRGMGIQVVDWDVSLPFEQIAKRDLERRAIQTRGIQR